MTANRTLKEQLARYIDPEVFRATVPDALKHTCPTQAKVKGDKLRFRRKVAMKHAEAAIRFLSRPENRTRLDARAK